MIRIRRNNLLKLFAIVFFSFLGFKYILKHDRHINSLKQNLELNRYEKLSEIDVKLYEKLYIQDISFNRLNRLFSILMQKENKYESVIKYLKLISFSEFLSDKENSVLFKKYPVESEFFLNSNDKSIGANENFIKYLYNKTQTHSFNHPRKNVLKSKINVIFLFILSKIS